MITIDDIIIIIKIDCQIWLEKGLSPLPKTVLQTVRSSAFCFTFQLVLFFFKLVCSCLPLVTRLLVPSISNAFWKQFLRKMWPIQLAFICFIAQQLQQHPQQYDNIKKFILLPCLQDFDTGSCSEALSELV